MRKLLFLTLISVQLIAQTNAIFSAQTLTGSGQTSGTIKLGGTQGAGFPNSFSVGTITLTGASLTTATFSVYGSSDNGVTFYQLPISTLSTPTASPSLTVTATGNSIYQINLAGISHVQFVTSGTFTGTSISLVLTASPNGSLSKNSGASSSTAIVASGTVTGKTASLTATTIYTVATTGPYEVCTGDVVTVAGAANATLLNQITYFNPAPSGNNQTAAIGQTLAATTIGADSANTRSNPTCQTFLMSAGAVQLVVTIGGSPATNPTYTYWYSVIQK